MSETTTETRLRDANRIVAAERDAWKAKAEQLRAELAELRDLRVGIKNLTTESGAIEMSLHMAHDMMRAMVAGFVKILDAEDAPNYVELVYSLRDDPERYTVTIQRPRGKTPAEVAGEAKRQARQAEAELARIVAGIERVRADCEAQTAGAEAEDMDHGVWLKGVWAQARRTLNILDSAVTDIAAITTGRADGYIHITYGPWESSGHQCGDIVVDGCDEPVPSRLVTVHYSLGQAQVVGSELGDCPNRCFAAPGVPETTEKPAAINVPDRIDYDSNGELDDVVVKNCDAHLERMNTGRWYLGLYGNGGRIVQIDIASKTGRAEVTGLVKHSEGIVGES